MAKTVSWIFGVIFIIAGVWGFVAQPAIGFIAANWLSSLIHLVVGIILLAMASKPSAVTALKTVGVIYIIWALLGFIGWNIAAMNGVTTWFYLIVGIVIAVLGWTSAKGGMSAPMGSAPTGSAPQM